MNRYEPQLGPEIQDRDLRLLYGLLESRVMTRDQIARLYFNGSYEYTKKRIAKLVDGGYLTQRKPRTNPGHYFPAILSLGHRGFEVLRASPYLASFPTMTWAHLVDRIALAQSTLTHELELIDHKVALSAALRGHRTLVLEEFLTWPTLYQFETDDVEPGKRFVLKPDAFLIAREEGDSEHSFFVEYDRSKEAGRHLMRKAWGYHRFYTNGGFAVRNGATPDGFKEHPFRILYVFPTEERRNAIAERLLQVHRSDDRAPWSPALLKNQHWLTTSAAFLAQPLGPIWLTLGEYWRVTEGTAYDPRAHVTMNRTTARDRLVATHAALHALFEERHHG